MKFWYEAILEKSDGDKQCCKCRVWAKAPQHIFVEFQLKDGGMPHPDELHPEPTGKAMCAGCAKMTLI